MDGNSHACDVLHLNVGGLAVSVARATLLQAPEGSLMHSMFSGRWDGSFVHDVHGRLFFDYSQACFSIIIDYLRTLSIATKPMLPPVVAPENMQAYSALVEYLGIGYLLHGCLEPCRLAMCFEERDLSCASREFGLTMEPHGCMLKEGRAAYVSVEPLGEMTVVWKVVFGGDVNESCSIFLGVAAMIDGSQWTEQGSCQGWHFNNEEGTQGIEVEAGDCILFRFMVAQRSGGRRLQMYHMRLAATVELLDLCGGVPLYTVGRGQDPAEGTTGLSPSWWRIYVKFTGDTLIGPEVSVCMATPAESAVIGASMIDIDGLRRAHA